MGRVFVVQEPLKRVGDSVVPRINYNTLKPYGEIRFLFTWGELKDDDALENTASLLWKLRTELRDFGGDDYIVCLGNPALIGMAITIAAECNDGSVNILDWIRDDRKYRVVNMDLHCQPERIA